MGEPANPTPAERAERKKIATAIVESVRNDEKMPLPFTASDVGRSRPRHMFDRDVVEELVFKLAQEITILLEEQRTKS